MIDGKRGSHGGGGGGGGGGRSSGVVRGGIGGSRIKCGVERIFEAYLEIALSADASGGSSSSFSPRVVRKYPADFADEEILKSAVNFAFPTTGPAAIREAPDHGRWFGGWLVIWGEISR